MATIVLDCPHCETHHVTVDLVGGRVVPSDPLRADGLWCYSGFCRRCSLGISLLVNPSPLRAAFGLSNPVSIFNADDDYTRHFDIRMIWPRPPAPNVPQFLPPDVDRAFREAEESQARGATESAAMMYRKALERGVKTIHGFEDALAEKHATLASVVRRLAASGKLTQAIADWAEQIRLLGNDGAHESEPPTRAEIKSLSDVTRMVLIYLFEMPAQVEELRARTSSGAAA